MLNHANRIGEVVGTNIFQNLLCFQVVKIDFAECTSGMVAALDFCLAFVNCDSTAKVHEQQEVNHDCVKCREMASGTVSVEVMMHGPTCSCMYCTWPQVKLYCLVVYYRGQCNVKCLCYINIIYSNMYLSTGNWLLEKMTAYQTCPVL